jgi:hypothetical protein
MWKQFSSIDNGTLLPLIPNTSPNKTTPMLESKGVREGVTFAIFYIVCIKINVIKDKKILTLFFQAGEDSP